MSRIDANDPKVKEMMDSIAAEFMSKHKSKADGWKKTLVPSQPPSSNIDRLDGFTDREGVFYFPSEGSWYSYKEERRVKVMKVKSVIKALALTAAERELRETKKR